MNQDNKNKMQELIDAQIAAANKIKPTNTPTPSKPKEPLKESPKQMGPELSLLTFSDLIREDKKPIGKIEIVNYSDKALALFGDTKPLKEKLKAIGGRFNPFLNHNNTKMAGWIFSKTKESQLKSLI